MLKTKRKDVMALVKTTFLHLRRTPYQSLAATLVMTLTFFVAAIFILINLGSGAILSYFEGRPQITAFFKEQIKEEKIKTIEKSLLETGKTSQVKYVSQEEALAIYREQNKEDPLLLELVTANILPASLEVSAREPKYLGELAEILRGEKEIEEVVFQKDVVEGLTRWTGGVRTFGLVLLGFLSLVSLLIILMVISMKIALRREEISIMKLVGASNWYIRFPFLLEGAIYGGLGAVLATVATFSLLLYASPFLRSFLEGIPFSPLSPDILFPLLGIQIVGGVVIGVLGSMLAIWRYLKE